MTLVFDTGVLVAAARDWEPEHEACRSLLSRRDRRVVPAPVLVESSHFLAATPGWTAILDDVIAGALDVVDLAIDDYARVQHLQRTYHDVPLGFVDCAVLAVVERLQQTALATLDERHFRLVRPRHVEALTLLPADTQVAQVARP